MTDPRFDPNHDARYQRGYEPGDSADSGGSAMTELFAPTSPNQPEVFVGTAGRDSGALPVPADGTADDDEPLDQYEPRNPFIIALWILGPALIIGGMILQVRTITATYFSSGFAGSSSAEVPIEMVMQQLIYALAPAMISTGLLTVVGLLFAHALRWRSRSSRR
ncbi:hypothetical protein [Cryobacterium sp. Hh38]|uniref:hypothetical protein n=1 Tax=Cryobacterium sp. Hh38 TaxID=1259156 RepID=UPI00106B6D9A|nr:hypothetical protein [Cryobacterium sp. Hh38]TFD63286.1 hypothetical protein E3T41_05310 [Cryobacterium sp. Hh38]